MPKGKARRRIIALWGATLAATLALACGASPRMVHQSAYYFERCHAADLDGERTVAERQACWAAWLRHWSSAQPAVRVRYAERRLAALSRGEAMAPLPFAGDEAPEEAGDGPPENVQVLVEASDSGGPPHVELAPGEEASETEEPAAASPSSEASTEAAQASADRDPVDPPRPGPPPPPVREVPPPPPPRAPVEAGTHPCTELCNPRWDLCVRRCQGRGAPCLNACRSEYRVCMGACR